MAIQFYERTRMNPARAHISNKEQTSQRYYVLFDDSERFNSLTLPLRTALLNQISALLGKTITTGYSSEDRLNAGRTRRVMPLADPQYLSLVANDVQVLIDPEENYNEGSRVIAEALSINVVPGWADYNAYHLLVNFVRPPYQIFPDERLDRQELIWYESDNIRHRLYYFREWWRYCRPLYHAVDSRVSATVSSAMKFRAPGVAAVDNTPFNSVPDMMIPDTGIEFHWMQVPARYLTSPNSYLTKYRGRINQLEFQFSPLNTATYPPGSLLYMGAEIVDPYIQPNFTPTPVGFVPRELAGTFVLDEVVDIKLSFIFTNRSTDADPPDPANRNWIVGGHNLMPHFATKKFYYASATTDPEVAANQVPSYLSIPIEILFQDPDALTDIAVP